MLAEVEFSLGRTPPHPGIGTLLEKGGDERAKRSGGAGKSHGPALITVNYYFLCPHFVPGTEEVHFIHEGPDSLMGLD